MNTRKILLFIGPLGCLFMLGVLGVGMVVLTRLPLVRHMTVAEECEVVLPQNTGTIVYRRIGLHPFQAEYSHSVRLAEAGNTHPLILDTGVAGHMNVYWITGGGRSFVRLEDALGEYLWDLRNDELYLAIRTGNRAFLTLFQSKNIRESTDISDHDSNRIDVSAKGQLFVPWETVVGNGQETYLGAIFGQTNQLQFHNAASCLEQLIKPQW